MHFQKWVTIVRTIHVLLALCSLDLLAQDKSIVRPLAFVKCLGAAIRDADVDVDTKMNPYYLRGDFDGDRVNDFAIAVVGRKSGQSGVLICSPGRIGIVLGTRGSSARPFSDMPGDNFVAPNWEVATRGEVRSLWVKKLIPSRPRGEAIVMVWEDGMHYIYWDGYMYRWSGLVQ